LRLQIFFGGLYTRLDEGASSHGGRRTFVTSSPKRSSRPVVVFEMCNNSLSALSLSTTQRHIEAAAAPTAGPLRYCDTVQIRGPYGGIAASEPSARHIGS
jgi:hypothetical protein